MNPSFSSTAFGALETTAALTEAQIEASAHALLAQLTLAEKVGMMDGDPSFWGGFADMMNGG